MIVTIDGPAGAGKSSVARALARRLGFQFLDTGAMYRAVAYAALERKLDFQDADSLEKMARNLDIQWTGDRLILDGQDISGAIRSIEVTRQTRHAADHPGIRAHLAQVQRAAARGQDVVTEGRDQGSIVFPDAECKIFLTASPQERARRRLRDLQAQGVTISYEEVLADQEARDTRDRIRPVAPLVQADDAIEVLTDGMTFDEVVDRLHTLVINAGNQCGN